MRKVIVICAPVGIDLIKATEIASEKGIELIVMGKKPDIVDEFQNKIEIDKAIFELTRIHELEDPYIPSFKKTRKEKKQEYHFNHRKNWRKRK